MNDFLPISKHDMKRRNWDELDFIFISGDAYVDHPSFGPAIICRLLEKHGYKVGIIAQPDWHSTTDFMKLGKPRLGFLVSSGNLDSMLNKFTAAKKTRHQDSYSPGGKAGCRPDRAVVVYCNRLRECWKDVPIIIGGIEASLRRFAHYDYWTDSVRRSILMDSRADLLIYGMGEHQILEIAAGLQQGIGITDLIAIKGTACRLKNLDVIWDYEQIPSFDEVTANKQAFAAAFKSEYLEQDPIRGKALVQACNGQYILQNPPALPLSETEMDEIYDLPYRRTYHPIYEKDGGVPAIQEVQFSLVSHRGCFGGCNFCAIVSHQGRIIQHRSHESLLKEAQMLTKMPQFKGYIHDVGGPTANFRIPSCKQQLERGTCRGRKCLAPQPCRNLEADHSDYLSLLRKLRSLPKVKKVFIRSGIRFDYLLAAKDEFLEELCRYHISGQLKIAPEHVAEKVTSLMGKSGRDVYVRFARAFKKMNEKINSKQYLVPYFMSSHPGATLREAVELAEFIRDLNYRPEQVQDFIPTPGTPSTCMYYSGIDPLTGKQVYTAKDAHEKKMQRALMQYRDPKNYHLVHEALIRAKRQDLIGFGPKCLIRPLSTENNFHKNNKSDSKPDTRHKTSRKKC